MFDYLTYTLYHTHTHTHTHTHINDDDGEYILRTPTQYVTYNTANESLLHILRAVCEIAQ